MPEDINPYQAPQVAEQAEGATPLSWITRLIGVCALCVALLLIGMCVAFSASIGWRDVRAGRLASSQFVGMWLIGGYLSTCLALMGFGLLTRRQKMPVVGFALWAVPVAFMFLRALLR